MRLTVDGREVTLNPSGTLLDAIHQAHADVPTLCYDSRTPPGGSCRVCLVAVEGRPDPVPACSTPAVDGMRVHTDDPVAQAASRATLELIVSELPERALEIPADRSELVRVCEHLGVDGHRFAGARHARGRDDSHPYVKLDRDLCIACGRCVRMCDDLQGTFALTLAGRGFDTVVEPGAGGPWAESDCVACGACVDACPTGALSEPGLLDPRPIERMVRSTCGYCGVGCSLDVHVRDGEIAAVRPTRGAPVNRGHLCVKGRFAHGFVRSPDRLTHPLVRRDGRLEQASWEEAIALVAGELVRIRDAHGPDAIAGVSSSRSTNEENYLMQKLMRAAIGTNNVDNCARVCHAPSAAGLAMTFGHAGGTNPFDHLDRAEAILLAGSNATEAHPVVGARIKQRAIQGAQLVVVDPRRTELARYADVHLQARPGSNVAVFNALAHVLLEEALVDEAFLTQRAEGLDELRAVLAEATPEAVAEISGVPAQELRRAARIYGSARSAAIVYGLGVTEHKHGTEGVRALSNLAILTGQVGTPHGGGVQPLRGQNNVQGSCDMGALPDVLPGYQKVADDPVRRRFEEAWGATISPERGLRIPEMFEAAIDGRVKALYVFGEDLAQTDPDTARVEAALDACELVVVSELFMTRTAQRADVVLPAASFLEKDGTFVNFDRRFQRVRPALAPPGEAKPDFEILGLLGAALGHDLGCPTPAAAFDELSRLTPVFAGLSHERLDREGAIAWPCRSAQDPGEAQLYLERFETSSGRARLSATPYLPPGEEPDEAFPLVLVTGRRLEHYNSGSMTRRTGNLVLVPQELLEISPQDAERLGVRDGARVAVASRRGELELTAQVTERVAPGQVFMAFHFPEALANVLTSEVRDTVTGCPEYKVTAVRVAPA